MEDDLINLASLLGYKLNSDAHALLLLLYVQASLAKNEESFEQRLNLVHSETTTPEEKKQRIVDAEQKYSEKQALSIEEQYWIDVRELCETLFFLQSPLFCLDTFDKLLSIVDFESLFKLTVPDCLKEGEGNPILTRYKTTLCMKEEAITAYFKAVLGVCQEFNETMSFILMNNHGYQMALTFDPSQPNEFKAYHLGTASYDYSNLKINDNLYAFNLFALTAGKSDISQDKLIARMQETKRVYSPIKESEPVLFQIHQLAITASDIELVNYICEKNKSLASTPLLSNGNLPLQYAAHVAGKDVIEALLAADASALTGNAESVYPITVAILYGNDAAFDALLVPSRHILGIANEDNTSPIAVAFFSRRQDIALRLFEAALQPVTDALSDEAIAHEIRPSLKMMKQELTDDFKALFDFIDVLDVNKSPPKTHNDLMSIAYQFGNMVEIIMKTDITAETKSSAIKTFLNHKDVKAWIAQKDKASWAFFGASALFCGAIAGLSSLAFPGAVTILASGVALNLKPQTNGLMKYLGFFSSNVENGAHNLEVIYKH